MTANATAGDRQKCLDAGMNSYIAKPVKKESIIAAIQESLVKSSVTIEEAPQTVAVTFDKKQQNLQPIKRLLEEDSEVYLPFLKGFLETYSDFIDRLKKNIQSENFNRISEIAHEFKGVILVLEMESIVNLLLSIEESTRAHDIQKIDIEFDMLCNELLGIIDDLTEISVQFAA